MTIPTTPSGIPSPTPDYGMNLNKILIVDDLEDNRKLTAMMFRNTEFEICEADGAQSALKMIHEEMPFLVLSDIRMAGMTGYELCEIIKRDPETAHIAMIFMTAHERGSEHVSRGLNIGADDYIYRPFEREELMARVQVVARHKKAEAEARYQMHVLEQRNRELERKMTLTNPPALEVSSPATDPSMNPKKVLIVDDLAANRRLTSLMFRGTDFEISEADGAESALKMVREEKPFLVLSDIQMPDINGYELCKTLKDDPETAHIAVIFMTAHDRGSEHTARGLDIGADDYLYRPFEREELIARIKAVARLKKAEAVARYQMRVAEQRSRDLALLNDVGQMLASTLDFGQVLDKTTQLVQRALKAEVGSLWLLDEDRQNLVLKASSGPNAQEVQEFKMPLSSNSIAGYVVRSGEAYFSEDVSLDEKHNRALENRGVTTRSMLCVPLRGASGLITGAIQAIHSWPQKFSQSNLQLFQSVASSVSIAVENAQSFEKVSDFNEQLEGMVAERTHKLEQEQERTSTILFSMADALIVIDNVGNVTHVNREAENMLDIQPSEVFNKPIPPDRLDEPLWAAIAELARKDDSPSVAVDAKRPGGMISVEARSAKMRDENTGVTTGTVIVLRDLTKLKELDLMKARFMEGVTHDLKTPLAIIRTNANNFNTYYKRLSDNKRKELMEAIERQVKVLERLVGDALAMVRLDSGIALRRQDEDLIVVIDKIVEELRPLADQKRLKLHWHKPRSPLVASLDVEQIERMTRNLLDNAIKYTENGSIQVEALETKIEGRPVITLRISDTGIGMTPEHIGDGTLSAPIFERFHRADPAHTVPGTGLGLAIVKEIVLAHGGDVHVNSEAGKGSVFVVTLPTRTGRGE